MARRCADMVAIAKITAKGQTTIPRAVRDALHVGAGDLIAWEIDDDGTATVRRVQPMDLEYLRALEGTLSEWSGAADDEAYRELERHTVVRVPFPFTDRSTVKNRPAMVVSDPASFNAPAGHSVMAMITSEANPPWPLDCPIEDLASAGLPTPSKVRFKLFTLDHRLVRGELGRLSMPDATRVDRGLVRLMGGDPMTGRS